MRGRIEITWLRSERADPDAVVGLVADFTDVARDDIRIVHACRSCGSDRHGKPHVVMPDGHAQLHVSLSRSAGLALVAVTDAGPVGVDVEAVRPEIEDLPAWVRTESLVKATGHGLTIDPADIVDERWTSELDSPAGYVAAVTILTATPPTLVTRTAAPEG
ncbi:MAG: hypothetical protein ABW004_13945 [Aeromicrobium sp.]